MTSAEIRQKFLGFFEARGHKICPSSSLASDDPSVLLTTAGMQQFKKYYLDPALAKAELDSANATSVQKCFRTSDINEVGDESHLTFFEMLGNFSFGGYGKREAIIYAHDFITKELGLPIAYVTVFRGENGLLAQTGVEKDEESAAVWHELGIEDIREEGMENVFWGPTGQAGPCGPTTEIYCKNSVGEAVEIWNIVFNQFFYSGSREELLTGQSEKKLTALSTLGVDTGMGLERLAMVMQKKSNIFETDLFEKLITVLPLELASKRKRVFVDHARSATFLISDGVVPGNKGSGYILRRLLRRLIAFDYFTSDGKTIQQEGVEKFFKLVTDEINSYKNFYPNLDTLLAQKIFNQEYEAFSASLRRGLKEVAKYQRLTPEIVLQLHTTFGITFEILKEIDPYKVKVSGITQDNFDYEFAKHQTISRAGVTAKFTGGLADHEPTTIRLHTAHHLLLAALKRVLGLEVKQRGSNITQDRLRLDFSWSRKLTEEEKKRVEDLVNQKIKENLKVVRREMLRVAAEKIGAEMEFGQKYGETVSVYFIEESPEQFFSAEFCGGPHVARTGEIGGLKIIKEEAVAQGIRRIKAVLINRS